MSSVFFSFCEIAFEPNVSYGQYNSTIQWICSSLCIYEVSLQTSVYPFGNYFDNTSIS